MRDAATQERRERTMNASRDAVNVGSATDATNFVPLKPVW